MERIEKEYTRVEKQVWYEAWDGETFANEADCKDYENNARGVVGKKVQAFRVAKTNEYYLYETLGVGSEDYQVEIYKPQSEKDIDSLNLYMNMFNKDVTLIGNEYIGQNILVFFNCDRDWCKAQTIDEVLNELREHFVKKILKEEEKI